VIFSKNRIQKHETTYSSDSYAVIAEGLTKRFGHFTAVDNISFKVKKGEVFGFL